MSQSIQFAYVQWPTWQDVTRQSLFDKGDRYVDFDGQKIDAHASLAQAIKNVNRTGGKETYNRLAGAYRNRKRSRSQLQLTDASNENEEATQQLVKRAATATTATTTVAAPQAMTSLTLLPQPLFDVYAHTRLPLTLTFADIHSLYGPIVVQAVLLWVDKHTIVPKHRKSVDLELYRDYRYVDGWTKQRATGEVRSCFFHRIVRIDLLNHRDNPLRHLCGQMFSSLTASVAALGFPDANGYDTWRVPQTLTMRQVVYGPSRLQRSLRLDVQFPVGNERTMHMRDFMALQCTTECCLYICFGTIDLDQLEENQYFAEAETCKHGYNFHNDFENRKPCKGIRLDTPDVIKDELLPLPPSVVADAWRVIDEFAPVVSASASVEEVD